MLVDVVSLSLTVRFPLAVCLLPLLYSQFRLLWAVLEQLKRPGLWPEISRGVFVADALARLGSHATGWRDSDVGRIARSIERLAQCWYCISKDNNIIAQYLLLEK